MRLGFRLYIYIYIYIYEMYSPFSPVILFPAHAAVVLAFPSVATIIPHQPAEAESVAPKTKDDEIAMPAVSPCVTVKRAKRVAASPATKKVRK